MAAAKCVQPSREHKTTIPIVAQTNAPKIKLLMFLVYAIVVNRDTQ